MCVADETWGHYHDLAQSHVHVHVCSLSLSRSLSLSLSLSLSPPPSLQVVSRLQSLSQAGHPILLVVARPVDSVEGEDTIELNEVGARDERLSLWP